MFDILAIIASIIVGIIGNAQPSGPAANSLPPPNTSTTACLNKELVRKGIDPGDTRVPKMLHSIKKATRQNTTPGYEIDQCINRGSCDGPEIADYTLIAKNIRVDKTVFPNSFIEGVLLSDRQLVKQTDVTDNPILADRYKNRIYRTHCGDWCYTCEPDDVVCLDDECLKVECNTDKPAVELPFRGSFHCNFIFYLQDADVNGTPQIDPNGNIPNSQTNGQDPNTPKDGRLFSVYFRPDASLPKYVTCSENNPDSLEQINITPPYPIFSNDTTGMTYPAGSGTQWKLLGSFTARNTQILSSHSELGTYTNPLGLSGTFKLYRNLLDPEGNAYMYLVGQNVVEGMLQTARLNPVQVKLFSYYLLSNYQGANPQNKSLKLATFPFSNNWIRRWVEESKPAIYLYPEKPMHVNVKLHPRGYLTVSDPPYDEENGWDVIAHPDGRIKVIASEAKQSRPKYLLPDGIATPASRRARDDEMYHYLYYEANLSEVPDPNTGFIVEKKNLETFLRSSLILLGLTEKEIMDYLEYWMPRLDSLKQPYVFIYFLTPEEIEYIEPMEITMPIDTAIRIRTYFKPIQEIQNILKQKLTLPPARKGNSVVEWGGILDD